MNTPNIIMAKTYQEFQAMVLANNGSHYEFKGNKGYVFTKITGRPSIFRWVKEVVTPITTPIKAMLAARINPLPVS